MTIISQVITTVQGEGQTIGDPVLLIRFGNCDLVCDFCDTKWSNKLNQNKLSYDSDKPPFKIRDSLFDIEMFIDYIFKNHIKDYNITKILFTGGEPLLNMNFIEKFTKILQTFPGSKINSLEFETNGNLLKELVGTNTAEQYDIYLNISPKLNPKFYKKRSIKTLDDIIAKFRSIFKEHTCSGFDIAKFVYSKEDEKNIDKFINEIQITIPIYIMPLTPDYTKYDSELVFLEDFRKSCYDTIDYCLRRDYVFSPRAHIWLFNSFLHRNEFEDILKENK